MAKNKIGPKHFMICVTKVTKVVMNCPISVGSAICCSADASKWLKTKLGLNTS